MEPLAVTQGAPVAAAAFSPTTPGLHLIEARVGDAADPSGSSLAVRRIRVVVESPTARAPEPSFAVDVQGKRKAVFRKSTQPQAPVQVTPGTLVTLDGRTSKDLNVPPKGLKFTWTQLAGPKAIVSNPFSSVVTFVATDITDTVPRRYVFQLLVDSAEGSAEPLQGVVETIPEGAMRLGRGTSLVGVSFKPAPGQAGHPFDVADLADSIGASAVFRTRPKGVLTGPAGFQSHFRTSGTAPFAIDPTVGYLVTRRGTRRIATLSGTAWEANRRTFMLERGVNLVACPSPVPAVLTGEQLRVLTGSSFVGRVDETGRFELYVPGLTADFGRLEAGRGYILSVPTAREVPVPAGP
ncbi:MAG: hypothetical protein HY303_05090 [Candidatus Wallbacteria bacterium]|nr:hypothetical protein [Candidatus Wallbacteria bacterium]